MISSAVFSEDGRYRYSLKRRWSERPLMVWCMLNPSTADANQDDPTIRRCIGFALRGGYGGIHVVNLMAYRATDPAECLQQFDPCGPENDDYLERAARGTGQVVCAWGTKAPEKIVKRGVSHLAGDVAGADLICLGTTKNGSPRHPLYVARLQPLRAWRPAPTPSARGEAGGGSIGGRNAV